MARPLRIAFSGAFYHITARGNKRKSVFKSLQDREQFLKYLETATERYQAVIHAFCLIDNHYHLLLETPAGNLSQIMHHLNGAYTTYFNVKLARSGHLFQGRYTTVSLTVIGDRFGIGDSAVAQSYSRFLKDIKKDRRLRRQVDKIEKMIKMCNVVTPCPFKTDAYELFSMIESVTAIGVSLCMDMPS